MIDLVADRKINTLGFESIPEPTNSGKSKLVDGDVVPPAEQPENGKGSGTPELPSPTTYVNLESLAGMAVPSLGATLLALISDTADEARRANAEARKAQTQAVVQTIENQADKMRSQAVAKLGLGLTSAAVQIGSGITSTAMTTCAIRGGFDSAMLQAQTQRIQAITQIIGGGKTVFDATNEFVSAGYDVDIKKMDADIEKQRAYATQLDSVTDSLKQVISKAISVQSEIQANVNQTRTKILS